jgi:hypothetical protein
MFMLPSLVRSLVDAFESQRARDRAFLSKASDETEFERRLKQIEERDRCHAVGVIAGLYPR